MAKSVAVNRVGLTSPFDYEVRRGVFSLKTDCLVLTDEGNAPLPGVHSRNMVGCV